MNLFYSMTMLLVLVVIELLVIKYSLKEEIPWKEIILNMNSGHIFLWVSRGLEMTSFYFISQYISFHWVSKWNIVCQWGFTLFAWDFCFYWYHRFHHTFPLLWNVHVVHHQGEHYSLSLGIRNSWYSSLSTIPFFAILAIIGVPIEIFMFISAIHYTVQFYNHNHLVKKSGWLEYIMVTPSHHRVHHGSNPEYINKNCGGTFVFWDKMFGTFQAERDDIQIKYGAHNAVESYNPFWANTIPFLQYFKMKLPNIVSDEKKENSFSDAFNTAGAFILFVLLLLYVHEEQAWSGAQRFLLFVIVFLSTISLSEMGEGNFISTFSWIFFSVIANIFFVTHYKLYDIAPLICFGLFLLHGLNTTRRTISVLLNKKKQLV